MQRKKVVLIYDLVVKTKASESEISPNVPLALPCFGLAVPALALAGVTGSLVLSACGRNARLLVKDTISSSS